MCQKEKNTMRSYIAFLLTILFFIACKKQKNGNTAFAGIWVETSLRLDTFDFDFGNRVDQGGQFPVADFNTNSYIDTVLNPNYPVSHSTTYNYYFTNDMKRIQMRNFLSSSSYFGEFKFSLSGDKRKFTIDKFYSRRSLPAVIEFERIK
jgi:hypothetical protein